MRRSNKRFIGLFLAAVMVTGLIPGGDFLPITARAAALSVGDEVKALEVSGAEGSYVIGAVVPNDGNIDMAYDNQVLLLEDSAELATRIIVASNVTVTIVLNGANRKAAPGGTTASSSPLEIGSGADVTLILASGSDNTFTATGTAGSQNRADAGINVAPTASLTILREAGAGTVGRLTATGSRFSAGIGAGANQNCGAITIAGGEIFATSGGGDTSTNGNGAGIGGGGGGSHAGGYSLGGIIICGDAYVEATSTGCGAGIGGAAGGTTQAATGMVSAAPSGNIKIYGNAVVVASSAGNGAGIGGGGASKTSAASTAGRADSIEIYGNARVTATSGENGSGIGGGGTQGSASAGAGGTISISGNAVVEASSAGYGAGIGGGGTLGAGTAGAGGDVKISGNVTVTATSMSSAGIGGGAAIAGTAGVGGDVKISGKPIVKAITNSLHSKAVGIGAGVDNTGRGTDGQITVSSGNVFATNANTMRDDELVINGVGDFLEMTEEPKDVPGTLTSYTVNGKGGDYHYDAVADSDGETYVWLPIDATTSKDIVITVTGVKETSGGEVLYSMTFWTTASQEPYKIEKSLLPNLSPTWILTDSEASKLLVDVDITGSHVEVELVYETGVAEVTIVARDYYDTSTPIMEITIENQVIGKEYKYPSLSIPGYQLVDASGANISPYDQPVVVANNNTKVEFFYKVATGNQLVIYQDDETGVELGRDYMDMPVNVSTPTHSSSLPSIPNYTTTATIESVTWDGSTPLAPIVYDYTRDKVSVELHAYDAATGSRIDTVAEIIGGLRKAENYDYNPNIADLTTQVEAQHPGGYSLAPQGSTLTVANDNVVRVYYNPIPPTIDFIEVECRIGSDTGTMFHWYVIKDELGATVTLSATDMPDFSALGFEKDAAKSTLSGEVGTTDKLILVYQDTRFTTTIKTDPTSVTITDKTAKDGTKMLYPPYMAGHFVTHYSINNGGTKVEILPDYSGYEATAATDIIFYYAEYKLIPTTGNLTILVTDSAGVPLTGVQVDVSVDGNPISPLSPTDADGKLVLAGADFGEYEIEVSYSGYRNAVASVELKDTDPSQLVKIVMSRNSSGGSGGGSGSMPGDATLTIRCVDENGDVIYSQSVSAVLGATETIIAPPLKGHTLMRGELGNRQVTINGGTNTVTFRYVADKVIIEIEDPKLPTDDGEESNTRPPVSDAVHEMLETDRHMKYISGYPDGTVRPDSGITRAEVASILWLLIRDSNKTQVLSGYFDDVNDGEWYARAVNYLASVGIINGYEDGTFRPERRITRAEFTALISHFDDLERASVQPFSDVPDGHWASDYIVSAYLKGWIGGYPGGVFKPENQITRAEVVSVINRILGRGIRATDIPTDLHGIYTDLSPSHWAFAEMFEASLAHDYVRLENGYELHTSYH